MLKKSLSLGKRQIAEGVSEAESNLTNMVKMSVLLMPFSVSSSEPAWHEEVTTALNIKEMLRERTCSRHSPSP